MYIKVPFFILCSSQSDLSSHKFNHLAVEAASKHRLGKTRTCVEWSSKGKTQNEPKEKKTPMAHVVLKSQFSAGMKALTIIRSKLWSQGQKIKQWNR